MLFYSHDENGTLQHHSLHASCPVLEPTKITRNVPNEKWILQQWFRTGILEASAYYHQDMAREIKAMQSLGRELHAEGSKNEL